MKHINLRSEDFPDEVRILRRYARKNVSRSQKGGVSWDELSHAERDALHRAKAAEQHGFCGYCECRLVDEHSMPLPGKIHIDHFLQRSKYPDRTWDWNNLVLSCNSENHCGKYKDKQGGIPAEKIIDLHSDTEDPREMIVFVEETHGCGSRTIQARAVACDERANNTIKALNLNDRKLAETRWLHFLGYKPALDEIKNAAEHSNGRAREEMKKLIRDIEREPYSSALLCCVRSALG